ncbi:MAG: type II toxin-antitoxin system VapC family toxin [Acidobacteriota bacterium]
MIVLDTHALIWLASDPRKLSARARRAIEGAESLGVAVITCFEIALLVERKRLRFDREVAVWLRQVLSLPRVELLALDLETSVLAAQLDWDHRDPADRMIVASAARRRAGIVTKDEAIRACPHATSIW